MDKAGVITTFAGPVDGSLKDDGVPARATDLGIIKGLDLDKAGNLYIACYNRYDYGYNFGDYNHRVRKVNSDGLIDTVAGRKRPEDEKYSDRGYSGDGGAATLALMNRPGDMAVAPDGTVYIADMKNKKIRVVSSHNDFNGEHGVEDIIFCEKTGLGYVMNPEGFHKKTFDIETDTVLMTFNYGEENLLESIVDQYGNQVIIEKGPGGKVNGIISPDGLETRLTVNSDNFLGQISLPNAATYDFDYSARGLLERKIDPKGNQFEYSYDPDTGLITDIFGPEGGYWPFSTDYEQASDGITVSRIISKENNTTVYKDQVNGAGVFTSMITGPAGGTASYTRSSDELSVQKSLSCGMNLDIEYNLDKQYKFKSLRKMNETTPLSIGN